MRPVPFALILLLALSTSPLGGQRGSPKLATLLADLAQVVPQDRGDGPAGPARPVSVAGLPASLQDATASGVLRVDEANQVQVYVLMSEVTDAGLRQLEAAGATVEIVDAGGRRVQARVAASRLERLAALPLVTFVRPPTYAIPHTGSRLSEGDAIHRPTSRARRWASRAPASASA